MGLKKSFLLFEQIDSQEIYWGSMEFASKEDADDYCNQMSFAIMDFSDMQPKTRGKLIAKESNKFSPQQWGEYQSINIEISQQPRNKEMLKQYEDYIVALAEFNELNY